MISAVICTYNPHKDFLFEAVESIFSQNIKNPYEFFIIDNASTYPVADIEFIRNKSIKTISESKLGLTAARECAARNANGDIIVFIDDDNILDPAYFQTIDTIFNDPRIGVASGTVVPRFMEKPQRWFKRYESSLALRTFEYPGPYLTSIPFYSYYFPIGAGMAVRKKIVADYFNSLTEKTRIEGHKGEDLSSGEDVDLDFFAISKGYLIGAFPRLRLTHIIPPNRCTLPYIRKIVRGAARSSWHINKKWQPVFGSPVLKDLDLSKTQLVAHLLLRLLLYPKKRYRVAFDAYRELLSLQDKG